MAEESKQKAEEAKQSRDLANQDVKELSSQNRGRVEEFKQLMASVSVEKKARDAANAGANEARKKRGETVKKLLEAKKAFYDKLEILKKYPQTRTSAAGAKKRMDEAEWTLQTTAASAQKEREMSAHVRELEKEFIAAQHKELLQAEASDLKAIFTKAKTDADGLDKEIRQLSEKANGHHNKMREAYEKAEKLREKISSAFATLDSARAKADAEHQKFLEVHGEFREEVQAEREEQKALREKSEKDARDAQQKKINEKASAVMEKFKRGEKISREEMLLLQQSGLF